MEKHVLSKPINVDGELIAEIIMDLDGLSALDLERAEREARKLLQKRESMTVPETNKKYQICVAAKAAGLPVTVLRDHLSGRDYTQICLLVMNFLLDGESEDEDEEDNGKVATPPSGETPTTKLEEKPKPLT
jgi:hypothetical protein